MLRSKHITMKGKQRNILLIGPSNTTSFLTKFEEFWKCFDVQHNKLVGYCGTSCDRTTAINTNYLTVFDEQLCFVDTPHFTKSFEIRCLYETLTNLNVIDSTLIVTKGYLSDLELIMQKFFIATNYPREKIIFIIQKSQNVNILVTMINLELKLKEINLTTKMLLNKNVFLEEDVFTSNGMLSFCNRLQVLYGQEPLCFEFSNVSNHLKIISDIFPALTEIVKFTPSRNTDLNSYVSQLYFGPRRYIFCKKCTLQEKAKLCPDNCKCLDIFENEELQNCSIFNLRICKKCSCSVGEHLSLRHRICLREITFNFTSLAELEKNTILHIMSILYLFYKQHSSELPDPCKNLKKAYWSLTKRSNVAIDDPIYKIIVDKSEELESNSYQPIPEEVTNLLESFEKENWITFYMDNFIPSSCELKLIPITNMPVGVSHASTSKATQPRKPLKFPEMKTKLPNNSSNYVAKDLSEDLNDALEKLRKEFNELKLVVNKEINELKLLVNKEINDKQGMHDEIVELKREIESLKKQCL